MSEKARADSLSRERDRRAVADAAPDEMFRLLVATVRDYAIFLLDPAGRIATWNAGAERIKGYKAEEIIGRHFSTFYPEEDVRSGKCEMELEVAAREGRFEDEGWRVRKDGSQFWANVVITALRDDGGRLVGYAKVTRDLTERKRAEDDRTARLAAEQATRAKDEFLAMLGHELRNPLAPISTALQLMKLRGDSRSAREQLVIERQLQQMMRLVDDLLDVSRIARGKLEIKKEPTDVRDAIARAVEIAGPLFEQKNQHFEVKAPGRALIIDGDATRLTQVFSNLLTNAAKYTDHGGHVFVLVRQVGDEIVVEVRDDGIGIPAEQLPRIFDMFVQGEQKGRASGGLGIGLTLVRTLVQLHGGSITARSNGPRLGSSFTVTLPAVKGMAPNDDEDDGMRALPGGGHCRILVVDDNDDARTMLSDLLVSLGHEVRSAGDAMQALALVHAFTPDIAILDLGLPGMDGYELARRLRETPATAQARLIALSGYAQPSAFERSRDAGFDRHLVKPVDIRMLLDLIARPSQRE